MSTLKTLRDFLKRTSDLKILYKVIKENITTTFLLTLFVFGIRKTWLSHFALSTRMI